MCQIIFSQEGEKLDYTFFQVKNFSHVPVITTHTNMTKDGVNARKTEYVSK